MKHLKKRLLAGLLAGAVLFTSVYAVETNDFAEGTATGGAALEGTTPEEIVDVQVPTDNAEIFNFYLDPNERLRRTGGGRYSDLNPDIDEGKLYFLNKDAEGNLTGLSCRSDDLFIYNRGMTPLNVSLSVSVSSTPSAAFAFVSDPGFFDGNGAMLKNPSMYLALSSGSTNVPVSTADGENKASLQTWVGGSEDCFELSWSENGKYFYQAKSGLTSADFKSVPFHMTGLINDSDWGNLSSIQLRVVWTVSKSRGAEENPYSGSNQSPMVGTEINFQKLPLTG